MGKTALQNRIAYAFKQRLETENLILRKLRLADASAITRMYNADDQDWPSYEFGPKFNSKRRPYSVGYVRTKIIPHVKKHFQEVGSLGLYVFSRQNDGAVGHLTIWLDSENRPRLAPYVLPSNRGQGIAKEFYEAALLRLDQAGMFPSGQVYAEVSVRNTASQRFFLAINFRISGPAHTVEANIPEEDRTMFPLVRDLS